MKWTMARWPLMSGVSMETIPTYGITRGIEMFVSHRYQSTPELTKKAPARNLRTSLNLIATLRAASAYRTMKMTSHVGNVVTSHIGNMPMKR
jgi:hypothetical protein